MVFLAALLNFECRRHLHRKDYDFGCGTSSFFFLIFRDEALLTRLPTILPPRPSSPSKIIDQRLAKRSEGRWVPARHQTSSPSEYFVFGIQGPQSRGGVLERRGSNVKAADHFGVLRLHPHPVGGAHHVRIAYARAHRKASARSARVRHGGLRCAVVGNVRSVSGRHCTELHHFHRDGRQPRGVLLHLPLQEVQVQD